MVKNTDKVSQKSIKLELIILELIIEELIILELVILELISISYISRNTFIAICKELKPTAMRGASLAGLMKIFKIVEAVRPLLLKRLFMQNKEM